MPKRYLPNVAAMGGTHAALREAGRWARPVAEPVTTGSHQLAANGGGDWALQNVGSGR